MTSLAYDARGTGPAVVMLSSGAHDRHDYDGLRDRIPGTYRTIAADWPAHGETSPEPEGLTAMRCADLAEDLVVDLAPDGAVVIGNSVGGFAAARLAIRRPELVRGLVLIDGGGLAAGRPHERFFCSLMARPRFLRAIYPSFAARYMRAGSDEDRRVRDTAIATTRRDSGLEAVAGLWRSFTHPDHDLRAGLGRIAAPTLIVWGRKDPVLPLRIGRSAAEQIPGAELVVLEAGHAPQVSDPDSFTEHLLPFLARAVGEQRAA